MSAPARPPPSTSKAADATTAQPVERFESIGVLSSDRGAYPIIRQPASRADPTSAAPSTSTRPGAVFRFFPLDVLFGDAIRPRFLWDGLVLSPPERRT